MIPEPIQNILPGITVDSYEGYGKERTELLKFIEENGIQNVVFVAADVHTTYVNNLTYQELGATGIQQFAVPVFEITTGSVAFDQPTGEILAGIVTAQNPALAPFYNSLPINPDPTDSATPDDKDDFVEQAINAQTLAPGGFDPLGLDNNLAIAEGLIDAELLQGDYYVGHTFGWTQFDIDATTQALTITTYGIEAYSEAELLADPEAIISRQPRVVSQFVVNPNVAPVVNAQTFSLTENSPVGTLVGTIVATDENENQKDLLGYSIVDGNSDRDGDGDPAFVIDEETGTITVFDDDELDFEVNPSFALLLTVVDAEVGGLSDTATITINLTDVNEAPVVENQTFSLVENSDPDTVVGVVTATDRDANTTLTYSITAGNTDVDGDGTLAFAINSSSGEITVNDSGDLDFENAVNTFDLTVQVSDGELSDTAIATINLTDTDVEIISEDPDTEIPPRAQTIEDADTAASYLLDIFSDLFEDDPSARTQVNAVIAEAGNRLQDIVDELTYLLPAATTATALATLRQDVSQAVQSAATRTNAGFNNLVGFYVVTDALTGAVQGANGEILPGENGYAQEALSNVDFNIRVGGSQTGTVGEVNLLGGIAYAPFVIANGAQFASNPSSVFDTGNNPLNQAATASNFTTLPVVYFGFIAANPDLAPHIKRLQGDIFGFEDLPAGVGVSDYDFNDGTFTFG